MCEICDFKNKNVLSVASSGDQYFSFLLSEASNVDLFDINLLTEYYIILKQIFILSYDLEDFINFFQSIGNCYNFYIAKIIKKQYERINKQLPRNVRIFWDYIINNLGKEEIDNMFRPFYSSDGSSPYLVEDGYQKLKQILKNRDLPNFKGTSIYSLNKVFNNNKYDTIYLSNIQQYENSKKYFNFIKEQLIKLLNNNGEIISGYSWYSNHQLEHINNGFEEASILPHSSSPEYVYVYKKR